LEQQLAEAKAAVDEPWAERIDGARRAVRDVDARIRTYVGEHLVDIVAGIEARGADAANRWNAAAAEMLAASADWNAAAAELGQTLTHIRRPDPFDVSRPASEQAVRAVAQLVAEGGETGVRLDRSRAPWDTLLGEPEPADVDELEPAVA
jgi:hypothetical protein